MPRRRLSAILPLLLILLCFFAVKPAAAEEFKIGIPPTQKDAAKKFAPLDAYLTGKEFSVKFVPFTDNEHAAAMMGNGELDGIFSGSGLGAILITRGVGTPLVRPVDKEGRSTYWAVVVASKGSAPFQGNAEYFKGKRVAFPSMAGSGEYFFLSLPGARTCGATTLAAPTHEVAIEMLQKGEVDVAIIKNTVWESLKVKLPELSEVGSDSSQNPNNTLLVSKKTSPDTIRKIMGALLAVGDDPSPEAAAVKSGLGIQKYIITSTNDFNHTIDLMTKAGVLK